MVNRTLSVFVVGAVMIGAAQSCFAHLGETEAEILERSRRPPDAVVENPKHSEPAEKVLQWSGKHLFRSAYIWRGRCVQESFGFFDKRGEKEPIGQNLEQAEAYIKNVGFAVGATWALQPHLADDQLKLVWVRSDRKALAIVTTHMPHELIIMDQTYVEAKEALKGKP